MAERILPLIKKKDKKVAKKQLEPIIEVKNRHFIKNKTLYPLMMEKEVVYFTLLEGEIIRGIVTGFSRFDITMGLKGGVPLTFFRHSIFDARNKKGRCLLKGTQQVSRDWKKSALFSD
jgi:sRNA-binding regulator protein Hfq